MEQEPIDLFDHHELIPDEVNQILLKYPEVFELCLYGDETDIDKALKELESIGYTFEYAADGMPFNLHKM